MLTAVWSYGRRAIVLALGVMLSSMTPLWAQFPEDPPATPREFHEREWQRIVRLFEKEDWAGVTEQSDFDVTYYELRLSLLDYQGRTIRGDVAIKARSVVPLLTQLVLDLCSTLIVDSVWSAGFRSTFTLASNRLTVDLDRSYGEDERVDARVFYHGAPCRSGSWSFPSFSFYRVINGNRDTIATYATVSEPDRARDWWPCKDIPGDKADSARILITVPDTMTATSNGALEAVIIVPPSFKTFRWFERHPIATYLICLNATNFSSFNQWYVSQSGDSMPITHYAFPEKLADAQVSWNVVPTMVSEFADLFGEYPFVDEKYGHTMISVFSGGMEHQCNTSYGRTNTNGSHTYDYLVAHELAHQWWGDDVTLATWPDVWLNEGFASYAEALWQEHLGGFEALRSWQTNLSRNGVFDPSGPVYNPTSLFDANTVYNKGSWILHILRGVVRNDAQFFAALREYRARRTGGNATTAEFLFDMSHALNFEVAPYLYSYLYKTNRPNYRVSFGSGLVDGGIHTVVRIRQIQTNPDTTFRTVLDLRFSSGPDTIRKRIENALRNERHYFDFSFSPTQLTVDPDDWVLKSVSFESLPVTILNRSLDFGQVNQPYTETLAAVGGPPPYTWQLVGGALPSGVVLLPNGIMTGIPTVGGIYSVTLAVRDMASGADTVQFPLYVLPFTPSPPQDLTVRYTENDAIELHWRTTAPVDVFRVYRATLPDMSDAELIATTADTSYTDSVIVVPPNGMGFRFYYVVGVRYSLP